MQKTTAFMSFTKVSNLRIIYQYVNISIQKMSIGIGPIQATDLLASAEHEKLWLGEHWRVTPSRYKRMSIGLA